MRPAGEAAFAARREDRTAIYSFEQHWRSTTRPTAALRRTRTALGVLGSPAAQGYRRLATPLGHEREAARDAREAPRDAWSRHANGASDCRRSPGGRACDGVSRQPSPMNRLAVRPGTAASTDPGRPSPIAVAVEPGDRAARPPPTSTRTPRPPPPARRASASPRPGAGPRRLAQRSSHERVVPGRIAHSSDGRRQLRRCRRRRAGRGRRSPSSTRRGGRVTVRNSASSAPARRASSRANT